MSLGNNQELFCKDVVLLLQKGYELGYSIRLGEVMRPIEMQAIYVRMGRSKTMESQHIKKLAIDLVLLKDSKICTHDEIKPLGEFWEQLSPENRWGGSWKGLIASGKSNFVDAPHFERQG